MKISRDPQIKTNFYQLANEIGLEIKNYREKKWDILLEKFHILSLRAFSGISLIEQKVLSNLHLFPLFVKTTMNLKA